MSGSQQLVLAEGAGGAEKVYIEDVFSTWLYTGNGSTQTITNGVDLAGKGGLVWIQSRSASLGGVIFDSLQNLADGPLYVAGTNARGGFVQTLNSLNANGFTVTYPGSGTFFGATNMSPETYASWTFRKQPKFFDVVTYTGDGASSKTISHSLGSTPGTIIVKRTSGTGSWQVFHRSLGNTDAVFLNNTNATGADIGYWNNTSPTSTNFTIGSFINANGSTYVAYLFAHNAGGFGLTGTDNVISCGSYTGNGSTTGPTVTLGYEPQWVMIKSASSIGNWVMQDVMRGMPVGSSTMTLWANLSNAESDPGISRVQPTATGFQLANTASGDLNANGETYIYIAIRRGPMKTPTTGTSVFNPLARTGTGTNPTVVTTNNNPDLLMSFPRTASPAAYGMCFWDKLRGISPMLQSASTSAETNTNTTRVLQGWLNTGYQAGADFIEGYLNYSGSTYVNYPITRAPGFFDVVCWTGTNPTAQNINHNLGVAPELIIVKRRSGANDWLVYAASLGKDKGVPLNLTDAPYSSTNYWNDTTPTSSVFSVGNSGFTNLSGATYVGYLFASCPGVSKVGSYTGTGSTLQINCGFTGGARFVLIKRTDSAGDWYVWDSARGIVSGNDPYLLLNTAAAEVTNTDWVDTHSPGFELSNSGGNSVNISTATYIFLAIA